MPSTQIKHEHYIKTSECHIPYIPKLEKKLNKKAQKYKICSKSNNLISVRFEEKTQQYILHVNDSLAQLELKEMQEEFPTLLGYNCSYQEIKRANNNYTAEAPVFLGEEIGFVDGDVVPKNFEGIQASCRNELAEDLQSNSFAFVQPQRTYPPLNSWHRRPNVIMIGVGGISQPTFRRDMPKVFNHLKTKSWFKMNGYTKVGEKTLPNLMALLTGYSPHNWSNLKCNSTRIGCLKSLPLIWKRFKKKGYITAYADDLLGNSMFNLDKLGFLEQPVDFYASSILNPKTNQDCINSNFIDNYCEQFLKQHANSSRPLFGVFLGKLDKSYDTNKIQAKLMEKLMKFQKMGVLSQSIVILFSDQGKDKDSLRESLPLLFIWLPVWFKTQHPELVQGLRINSERLTSPYDLHLTLQHILELGEKWPQAVDRLVDCPTCQTLFAPVPENRTCSDAGIGESICPCDSYKLLNTKQIKQMSLGKLLVQSINQFLYDYNLQETCENLTLKSVKVVQQRRDKTISSGSTYRVEFSATPNSRFSATTRYNHKNKTLEYINVGAINRLDSYGNYSECMRRLPGRKFCICKAQNETEEQKNEANQNQELEKATKTEKPTQITKSNQLETHKNSEPKKPKPEPFEKIDLSLFEYPDMKPEIDQQIEIISV
ncbi:uncharacterized protein LOC108098723 [Drosophila ficusphila]|uniref:uncharacterized protein LOC108098723 n=1 Tax=Drosophila ficusphila TaxID=30025 RepID=UPI0007E5D0B1|nr:uncharacterized protein LOC108098723 [Drosophila ficusphila]